MTHRTAMIVHTDEPTRRLVSRALSVFSPAYQVVTADTLSSASHWIDTMRPDLLLLMGDGDHLEESMAWAHRHTVDPSRVILIGPSEPPSECRAGATVPEPVNLAPLLAAVRLMSDSSLAR